MDTARISALLEPFLESPLSPSQLDQISIYIDLLKRWNARINLTAIRGEEEIVTRHFGESLFLAQHLFPSIKNCHPDADSVEGETPAVSPSEKNCHPERSHAIRKADDVAESKDPYSASLPAPPQGVLPAPPNPSRVLDIGSGAGFPALPLKLWAPTIDLTLIESNQKKATFLREVVRTITLTNVNVISARAETVSVSPEFPRADVVTLRAVERFETILSQAATFLTPNGRLALLIGATQLSRLTTLTSIDWSSPISIPKSHSRLLSIGVHKRSGK
ncbi:MAG: 16S rRNA (guanine(527)-N(7))-methyltransferase RsmG [Terriglobales bacterium]